LSALYVFVAGFGIVAARSSIISSGRIRFGSSPNRAGGGR
jgi:hypothetical protein